MQQIASRPDEPPDLGWLADLEFVFHTSTWRELVQAVYGFEALPVELTDVELPLFHTRSPLLGSKLVTAVFNGYAGPLTRSPAAVAAAIAEATALARARRVDFLELRCVAPLPDAVVAAFGLIPRTPYRHTLLRLAPYDEIAARYDRKFRKNLRQARRRIETSAIHIERSDDPRDLDRFHELLVRRYRDRHAMVAQPRALFDAVWRRFVRTGGGDLWVARDADGHLLGGLVFLHHAGTVTGAWGAVDAVDPGLSLDAVMKDTTIRHYSGAGFSTYDFGLSSPAQPGLLFAKSRFGGVTVPTPWYYHLVRADRPPDVDFARSYARLRRVFQLVPVAVIRRIGPRLLRWLT